MELKVKVKDQNQHGKMQFKFTDVPRQTYACFIDIKGTTHRLNVHGNYRPSSQQPALSINNNNSLTAVATAAHFYAWEVVEKFNKQY